MKILFAVMPWHSLEYPCLASGILSAVANSCVNWEAEQLNANLAWATQLQDVSDGKFSVDDYSLLCNDYVYCLAGEWVFSAALNQVENSSTDEEYGRIFSGPEHHFAKVKLARKYAAEFIDATASLVVNSRPRVLALSTTFTQSTACLALAKRVKQLAPEIITIIGGGNCDGVQGVALHRNFDFIDLLVRGEGEEALRQVLLAIEAGHCDFSAIPGLCWRSDGISCANDADPHTAPIVSGLLPEYQSYFSDLEKLGLRNQIRPSLVVEMARGCWWGEKHHCTFCGLNGSSMAFRSKDGSAALAELETLISKHQVLDVIVTDNILDTEYFSSFIPSLASKHWDVRMQYEIKANVKPAQFKMMRDAGIIHVQPGIESLSTSVLKLMRKGTKGCRNVQVLRDCEWANITVSWNYLIGFPGESEHDYRKVIAQMPLLHHLQPPRGGATRVSLQRFSPYFNDPELGFAKRRPHDAYELIYQLPREELDDLGFFFMTEPSGIGREVETLLRDALVRWDAAYASGNLLFFNDLDGEIEIVDTRDRRDGLRNRICNPVGLALHRSLRIAASVSAVRNAVMRVTGCRSAEVDAELERFSDWGLIFHEGEQVVGLDTEFIPFHVRPVTSELESGA